MWAFSFRLVFKNQWQNPLKFQNLQQKHNFIWTNKKGHAKWP